MAARNMYRIDINIHKKLCVKLAIYKDYFDALDHVVC